MNLYLDGSGSYDPDVDLADKAGIHFEWYCRRMSESFPADYKTSDTSAGCFKDGHYNISVSSESQMLTEVSRLSETSLKFADSFHLRTFRLMESRFAESMTKFIMLSSCFIVTVLYAPDLYHNSHSRVRLERYHIKIPLGAIQNLRNA